MQGKIPNCKPEYLTMGCAPCITACWAEGWVLWNGKAARCQLVSALVNNLSRVTGSYGSGRLSYRYNTSLFHRQGASLLHDCQGEFEYPA